MGCLKLTVSCPKLTLGSQFTVKELRKCLEELRKYGTPYLLGLKKLSRSQFLKTQLSRSLTITLVDCPSMKLTLTREGAYSTKKFQQKCVNEESSTERLSYNRQIQRKFSTVMSRLESMLIRQD